jgi:hypothetical protein
MRATNRKLFLLITAFVEAATGFCLLLLPDVVFRLLLGVEQATAEAILVGRIAGAALLAIGVASWLARADASTPAQRGLLTGILIYDAAASMLLAFAGAILKLIGALLCPRLPCMQFLRSGVSVVCVRTGLPEVPAAKPSTVVS